MTALDGDPRYCVACTVDGDVCSAHYGFGATADAQGWADDALVQAGFPARVQHSHGVALRMIELAQQAPVSPAVVDAFGAIGVTHDVGYAFPVTGMHALDGALCVLRGGRRSWLAPHIAWHSTAAYEYEARGMRPPAIDKPTREDHAFLWVADFTTSPAGAEVSPQIRIDEIRSRYAPDSPVVQALNAAVPEFNRALEIVGLDHTVS